MGRHAYIFLRQLKKRAKLILKFKSTNTTTITTRPVWSVIIQLQLPRCGLTSTTLRWILPHRNFFIIVGWYATIGHQLFPRFVFFIYSLPNCKSTTVQFQLQSQSQSQRSIWKYKYWQMSLWRSNKYGYVFDLKVTKKFNIKYFQ